MMLLFKKKEEESGRRCCCSLGLCGESSSSGQHLTVETFEDLVIISSPGRRSMHLLVKLAIFFETLPSDSPLPPEKLPRSTL